MNKALILPLLLLLTGCGVLSPDKDVREEAARLRDLRLQKMCSEAGTHYWKEFKESYIRTLDQKAEKDSLEYSNHYNQQLNKCLVQVDVTLYAGDFSNPMYISMIVDAFEKNLIAQKNVDIANHEQASTSLSKNRDSIQVSDSNLKWFDSLMTK